VRTPGGGDGDFEAGDGVDLTELATRIARKTLLAVAGLVSMPAATWSTDRRTSGRRWDVLERGAPVETLTEWLDAPPSDGVAVCDALEGPVAQVVQPFRSECGLWRAHDPPQQPTRRVRPERSHG
jgi:hypothetical protein